MGVFRSAPSPLQQLGFRQKAKIIIEGQQGSGRKTLLVRLTDFASKENYNPFMNYGYVQVDRVRFQIAGVRNELNARATWEEDIQTADAVIYLIDASDSDGRKNVGQQQQLRRVMELKSKKTPVLVYGNKIDKQAAATEVQLLEQLNLNSYQSDNRPKLVMCSLLTKANLPLGLRWIAAHLN